MKKAIITLAIILGLGMGGFAQYGTEEYAGERGLFGLGLGIFQDRTEGEEDPFLSLPDSHGEDDDQNAPLGNGVAILFGLGAAYLVGKKRKEE